MSDGNDTTRATRQVAWALVRLGRDSFTYNDLRASHRQDMEDDLVDWTAVVADFTERGYFLKVGASYRLTAAGQVYTDTLRAENFGEGLVRTDASKAYGHFCALVYGRDLGQFSMTTMDQLAKLMEILQLSDQSRVLDLGCGVGRITEYIADVTGAHVTGLDFAEPAIRRAQERTQRKAERITFVVGSMNHLDVPDASFDTIIALDTLYFATDLPHTMGALKKLLHRPGQMGLFWTQMVRTAEAVEQLHADKTRLAQALSSVELPFQTHDYTTAEKQHWQRSLDVLEELQPEFEAEGSVQLYQERLKETQGTLHLIDTVGISRYLYHVRG